MRSIRLMKLTKELLDLASDIELTCLTTGKGPKEVFAALRGMLSFMRSTGESPVGYLS